MGSGEGGGYAGVVGVQYDGGGGAAGSGDGGGHDGSGEGGGSDGGGGGKGTGGEEGGGGEMDVLRARLQSKSSPTSTVALSTPCNPKPPSSWLKPALSMRPK